jgi:hypothetical protein
MEQQISKKYSLDWLVTGSAPAASAPDPAQTTVGAARAPRGVNPLDEAVIYYSEPIRMALTEGSGEMHLHDLVERVNAKRPVEDFEKFLGVVNYLAELGFVTYVNKDLRGNHLVRLLK